MSFWLLSLTSSSCYICHWHVYFISHWPHSLAATVTDMSLCCICHWCLPCCNFHPHNSFAACTIDIMLCCILYWHHLHAAPVTDMSMLHLSLTSSLAVHIHHWSWRQRRLESLWCWKGARKTKSIFQWILWYGCSFESVDLQFISDQRLQFSFIFDLCVMVTV